MIDWLAKFTGGIMEGLAPWAPSLVIPDGDPDAPQFLHLKSRPLPAEIFARRGAYGKDGDYLPRRFRNVHPDAWQAFMTLETAHPGCWYWSDMRRSASESMAAVRARRGALPAGMSTHNYGAAGDCRVDFTRGNLRDAGVTEMGRRGWKRELDAMAAEVGLYCFRTDGKRGHEDWHYNLGGHGYREGQRWIDREYGAWWKHKMTPRHTQRALAKLHLYQGDIDGIHGRLTAAALRAFQRTWRLRASGRADERTRRVLAFVTAVDSAA